MRRFYISVLIFLSVVFINAFAAGKYTKYVEVKIVPDNSFTLEDIKLLPQAPGSKIKISDDGSANLQITCLTADDLLSSGVQLSNISNFILVEPDNASTASIESEYGENAANVQLSPSEWKYSYIDKTSFPYAYTVTSVDVHYQVYVNGIVDLALTNQDATVGYDLEEYAYSSLNETVTGITAFNGQPVAQYWLLQGFDSYSSNSYIDYWWIKLYYEATESYCSASGGGDEYIYQVKVGSVDNVSGSSGYADYTSQSTSMNIGTSYPIEIITAVGTDIGYGYTGDRCGIWVDWNQDSDFDDTGEMVFSQQSVGYFATNITPPANALAGNTRMRVRLVFDQTLNPCGTSNYGETEDYTINVIAASILKVSGHVTHSDSSPVPGVQLEIYNGSGAGTPTGLTDITDATGYYEIQVPSPWTGHVKATKYNYSFSWVQNFTNVTTDQVQDISAYYKYSGGIGSSTTPYLIATPEDMNAIGAHPEDWEKYFKMTADIDMTGFTSAHYPLIGSEEKPFTGMFDGNNHFIRNFTYIAEDAVCAGLFGYVSYADIINFTAENIYLSGARFSALICNSSNSFISGCSVIGSIRANFDYNVYAAGIAAWMEGGRIEYCINYCDISSIGQADTLHPGDGAKAGGIVAYQNGGLILWCKNTALVDANDPGLYHKADAGGIVGYMNQGTISECANTGQIKAKALLDRGGAGGIAGLQYQGSITDSYNLGSITGFNYSGGLVGFQNASTSKSIEHCYSVGWVFVTAGTGYKGGLVGSFADCEIEPTFWNMQTAGANDDVGRIVSSSTLGFMARDTAGMKSYNHTYAHNGWDFLYTWRICDGTNYPKLQWEPVLLGDFTCPDGVDFIDYSILAKQWMLQKLSFDTVPTGGDGIVNFLDFAAFAENWQGDYDQFYAFASQWLNRGMFNADFAPIPTGDGIVDIKDLAIFAGNWLIEL